MTPDERTYRQHIARGRFRVGVDRGDWWLMRDAWPNPIIAVAAAARVGAPVEFSFRFDLNGYPVPGPTAQPWDAEVDSPLAHELWPAGTGRVEAVFNPGWKPYEHEHALYHPIDRLAVKGHTDWASQDPASIWDASRMDIVDYLKVIHDLLHSSQYSGLRRTP
jgi:hypothetical protein